MMGKRMRKKRKGSKRKGKKMAEEENEQEFMIVTSGPGNDTGHDYLEGEIGYVVKSQPSNLATGQRSVQLIITESPTNSERVGYQGNWLIVDQNCLARNVKPQKKLHLSFENVILPQEIVSAVMETLSQTKKEVMDKIFRKWGLIEVLEKGKGMTMLFYGPPGTGKTLLAEVIACHLGKKLRMVDAGTIQTSECGGTERNIKKVFSQSKKNNDVILFDECDSLIYDRRRIGMILGAEVNCLLSEVERFDGVCIFTTNNTPCLDPAFERRVSLKLEFPLPDKEARKRIWLKMFPNPEATFAKCVCIDTLSKYKISGGHIKNIALNAARRAAHLEKETIEMEDFMICLEREEQAHEVFKKQNSGYQHGAPWNVRGGPTGVDVVRGAP